MRGARERSNLTFKYKKINQYIFHELTKKLEIIESQHQSKDKPDPASDIHFDKDGNFRNPQNEYLALQQLQMNLRREAIKQEDKIR